MDNPDPRQMPTGPRVREEADAVEYKLNTNQIVQFIGDLPGFTRGALYVLGYKQPWATGTDPIGPKFWVVNDDGVSDAVHEDNFVRAVLPLPAFGEGAGKIVPTPPGYTPKAAEETIAMNLYEVAGLAAGWNWDDLAGEYRLHDFGDGPEKVNTVARTWRELCDDEGINIGPAGITPHS